MLLSNKTAEFKLGMEVENRWVLDAFNGSERPYWFTTEIDFHENERDFWVFIRYSGFETRGAAGTKDGWARSAFNAKQIKDVKDCIVEYYTGNEDKRIFPFDYPGCNFIGIIFDKEAFKLK